MCFDTNYININTRQYSSIRCKNFRQFCMNKAVSFYTCPYNMYIGINFGFLDMLILKVYMLALCVQAFRHVSILNALIIVECPVAGWNGIWAGHSSTKSDVS